MKRCRNGYMELVGLCISLRIYGAWKDIAGVVWS